MIVTIHPSRLKDTAQWIIENLSEDQYPIINHFGNDPKAGWHSTTTSFWEELIWFDHHDTVRDNDGRTPRRIHLMFNDEQAWIMIKLLQ